MWNLTINPFHMYILIDQIRIENPKPFLMRKINNVRALFTPKDKFLRHNAFVLTNISMILKICELCLSNRLCLLEQNLTRIIIHTSYYGSGSQTYAFCVSLCWEGRINCNNCPKCDPSLFRNINSGKCSCNSGYYYDVCLECKCILYKYF